MLTYAPCRNVWKRGCHWAILGILGCHKAIWTQFCNTLRHGNDKTAPWRFPRLHLWSEPCQNSQFHTCSGFSFHFQKNVIVTEEMVGLDFKMGLAKTCVKSWIPKSLTTWNNVSQYSGHSAEHQILCHNHVNCYEKVIHPNKWLHLTSAIIWEAKRYTRLMHVWGLTANGAKRSNQKWKKKPCRSECQRGACPSVQYWSTRKNPSRGVSENKHKHRCQDSKNSETNVMSYLIVSWTWLFWRRLARDHAAHENLEVDRAAT